MPAINMSDLSVLAYANGFTLWHYTTPHTAAEVEGTDYFANASDLLRVNDLIITTVDNDGTPGMKFYIIATNDNVSGVTVSTFSAP